MRDSPRVRFAPSPTGYLHVGGARTALFNWLFARSTGGAFVLRIEDTDFVRSTEESLSAILTSMLWLGLDWDEGPGKEGAAGPYFQSKRMGIYLNFASRLVESGHAYKCFCSLKELKERKEALLARKQASQYDGRCRELSEKETASREGRGEPYVLRFRVRAGSTAWDDAVKGRIEFSNTELDDFVMLRSDGTPTYNFAVTVDDISMRITHVIRGDEHISNTPRQVLLYEALGESQPVFAHIPMILGSDGTKLSKRHGAVALSHYQRQGFLPEAMVNFLALLGWSYDGTQEIFSAEELVEKFSLEKVSSNPSVFDHEKLLWLNGQYMKRLSVSDRTDLVVRYLREVERMGGVDEKRDWIASITQVLGERLRVASQITEYAGFFFVEKVQYDQKARELLLSGKRTRETLLATADTLEGLREYNAGPIEQAIRSLAEKMSLEAGELIHPARAALTGKTTSPGVFEVMELLGKKRSVARLREAADFVIKPQSCDPH
jgi:glutamyl-tRNA synthetase